MSLRLITPTDEEAKVMPLPRITAITRLWLRLSAIVTLVFACDAVCADPGENIQMETLNGDDGKASCL